MKKILSIENKIKNKLAINIKYKRSIANITQDELASRVGVERSYITAIENGDKCPSVYCLYFIAKSLGISIKDIMDINLD